MEKDEPDPRTTDAVVESSTSHRDGLEADLSQLGALIAECTVTAGKGSSVLNCVGDREKILGEPKSKKKKKRKKEARFASDQIQNKPEALRSTTSTSTRLPAITPMCSVNPKSNLEEELEWCILQLELGLLSRRTEKSQKEKIQKNIRTLQSTKMSLPKKRQFMRSLFGDYRSKMKCQPSSTLLIEKSRIVAKETKVETVKPLESVGTYFRTKMVGMSCADVGAVESGNSFRFNFTIPS